MSYVGGISWAGCRGGRVAILISNYIKNEERRTFKVH
mgnify:CR=1 FL=1